MPPGIETKHLLEEYTLDVNKPAAQLTTAFVELRENSSGGIEKVIGLELINTTAGAVTVSVEVVPDGESTGTAGNLVLDAFSVAAHTRERFYSKEAPYLLDPLDSFAIKASANTSITARLFVETPRA
jgi:hypothetical protein